jgi:nonribosomal peptide synthetase DhbF
MTDLSAHPESAAPGQPAAADEMAALVRECWLTALAHEDFGADSDFFAVGGNSLLAAKVMADLSGRLGTRLPMRLLFAGPTVRALGRAVAEHRGAGRC